MVRISDLFEQQGAVEQHGSANQPLPPGAEQIVNSADGIFKIAEAVTGLTRREISMQILKTGIRGGGLESIINGLMGKTATPEAKFVKYVKTLAIWVPIALGLTGFVIVALYAFLKLTAIMLGGI